MFKCNDCKRFFGESKTVSDIVPYGESTVTLDYAVCPYCNGDFDVVYPCKDCGEYFSADDLHSFYCIDCLKEIWDKPTDLFEFGEIITEKGNINQFALDMFGGIEGTNDILKLLLKSIFNCNPQMLKEAKEQFIIANADELSEEWERKENEQSKIL